MSTESTAIGRELLRVGALTCWVIAVTWALQSYVASRVTAEAALAAHETARDLVRRYPGPRALDGEPTMQSNERLSEPDLEALRRQGKVLVIAPSASVMQTADAVDYAVRRIGLGFVALADLPPDQFYYLSLLLLQRGYSQEEVEALIRESHNRQTARFASPPR